MSTPNSPQPNPLAAWRLAQGLTKPEAARTLRVALSTLYEWEGGRALPRPTTASRIEKITGVSRAALAAAMSQTP